MKKFLSTKELYEMNTIAVKTTKEIREYCSNLNDDTCQTLDGLIDELENS